MVPQHWSHSTHGFKSWYPHLPSIPHYSSSYYCRQWPTPPTSVHWPHQNTHTASPLQLRNVLIAPQIVKNLISVRALTRDNSVSVEFDPWGFSIKDLRTRMALLRCDFSGELYPLRPSSSTPTRSPTALLASTDSSLWHARLGHPGHGTLQQLSRSIGFTCSKSSPHTCEASAIH